MVFPSEIDDQVSKHIYNFIFTSSSINGIAEPVLLVIYIKRIMQNMALIE
jgi:hypothetical protein